MSKARGIRAHRAKVSIERKFAEWLERLTHYAISEAELIPDITADYWRECFDSGMSVEIAFRESFVEQDGGL